MKFRIAILTILFGFSSLGVFAQAQQMKSDYEIQKSFKEKYAQFQQRIEDVSSADSAKKLIDSIKEFEQEYSQHAELLNKALNPATYKGRMESLKRSSVIAKNRLQTIQQQTEKLDKLRVQVTGYEKDLDQLNSQTDSLKEAIDKSVQSEQRLSGMVREYRQNLEQRDELILSFIDSMVVAYQQMDLQELKNLENVNRKSRLESEGNALKMIHDISQENLDILEKNSENLRLQDYMRMAEVQQQFEKMWNSLGTKIAEVYDGENAEQMAQEVDQNIAKWNQALKTQTFTTLKDSLAANNISVNNFQNPEEFYSSLNAYLDKKIKQSKENNSQAAYKEFQHFKKFWNQIEARWSSNFVDAGLLNRDQMVTVNEKVDTWSETAEPRSNILVYLLGASVLLAIALGVMLIREKKNKHKT